MATPHLDPVIFEPLWNANSLGSLVRLAVSALYGLLIGWERQHSTHYTGARVFVIFTTSACLFSMSAELAVLDAGQGDVTRVAGQVVTGIGFVCAAFIFRERSSLRGVSTAVSLFMCGAIGITLGYGFLTEATAALVITLACLLLGRDQHSAAVDDRGSSDSITPVDPAHRHDEP
jgi:putative Mg2+ transporter-C (MgtC) family protein